MHVAMSASIQGSCQFAGSPYACSEGDPTKAQNCVKGETNIDLDVLEIIAKDLADEGRIDSLTNLTGSRAYVQGGASDVIVLQSSVIKSSELYTRFGCNVATEFTLDTGHSVPTVDKG